MALEDAFATLPEKVRKVVYAFQRNYKGVQVTHRDDGAYDIVPIDGVEKRRQVDEGVTIYPPKDDDASP